MGECISCEEGPAMMMTKGGVAGGMREYQQFEDPSVSPREDNGVGVPAQIRGNTNSNGHSSSVSGGSREGRIWRVVEGPTDEGPVLKQLFFTLDVQRGKMTTHQRPSSRVLREIRIQKVAPLAPAEWTSCQDAFSFRVHGERGEVYQVTAGTKREYHDLYQAFTHAMPSAAAAPPTTSSSRTRTRPAIIAPPRSNRSPSIRQDVDGSVLVWVVGLVASLVERVLWGLENLSDMLRDGPVVVFRRPDDPPYESYRDRSSRPSDVTQGLVRGLILFTAEVLGGVLGPLTCPLQELQKGGGLERLPLAIVKGIAYLVCKPIAGVLDLVTETSRGLIETPRTIMAVLYPPPPPPPHQHTSHPPSATLPTQIADRGGVISVVTDAGHQPVEASMDESPSPEPTTTAAGGGGLRVGGEARERRSERRHRRNVSNAPADGGGVGAVSAQTRLQKALTVSLRALLDQTKGLPEVQASINRILDTQLSANPDFFDIDSDGDDSDTSITATYLERGDPMSEGLMDAMINDSEFECDAKSVVRRARESLCFSRDEAHPEGILKEVDEWVHPFSRDDFRIATATSVGPASGRTVRLRSRKCPACCDVTTDAKGGLLLADRDTFVLVRSVAKEVLKWIGRQILSGNFNLTRISFPIRCSKPGSSLQTTTLACTYVPLYLRRAAASRNPIERLKLVVAMYIASLHVTSDFLKPINPTLGETYQAFLPDGTRIYSEQTAHVPQTTHWQIVGAEDRFLFWGYSIFSAYAILNQMHLYNSGKRFVDFTDGHTVTMTKLPRDVWTGTLYGPVCRHEILGRMRVEDSLGNSCEYVFGSVRGKPTDYFEGTIKDSYGDILSRVNGTWLGYLDFDNVRYWDIRTTPNYPLLPVADEALLQSDSTLREDLLLLTEGRVRAAQEAKDRISDRHRYERALRRKAPPPPRPTSTPPPTPPALSPSRALSPDSSVSPPSSSAPNVSSSRAAALSQDSTSAATKGGATGGVGIEAGGVGKEHQPRTRETSVSGTPRVAEEHEGHEGGGGGGGGGEVGEDRTAQEQN
ncbi:unnamed protein product [Vitrella brassicaformis CCMP3155]|uniref:PH domain-containing protein n=4 Tax=Vitrella brassicaformis TaxID=1169539 RepID=A0A0G4EVE0_VITBC|nr:unnamed protein product [Vitrella brassicaformis CCMP3155]|eukprot:CEM02035.1 unnamed protein product [Vitrella brassicaformis CCMP3155]